ncbi:hypothetical protein CNBG_10060 [Cryptococcus deuterogattii R265]|uniref:uncharacterized protein n=1 Tax=Cryptococcus deuterogattii (strain R265) TaxID=294750 RepID=UPI001936E687|nr:hypothetical protein CNBG_10060 [Cryptococcus deuterogattii R265]
MSSSIPQPTFSASQPTPVASPIDISARELKELMDDATLTPGKDYVVVDVRRTDLDEPGSVIHPCAINLPAQSLYQTLPVVFMTLRHIPKIIFHCSSSKGRGPRCAGWYQNYANSHGPGTTTAYVLVGGIKAWKEAYPEQVKHVH